jgi:hypothetical protein
MWYPFQTRTDIADPSGQNIMGHFRNGARRRSSSKKFSGNTTSRSCFSCRTSPSTAAASPQRMSRRSPRNGQPSGCGLPCRSVRVRHAITPAAPRRCLKSAIDRLVRNDGGGKALLQSLGNLPGNAERFLENHLTLLVIRPDIVQRADVGMIQRCSCAYLTFESVCELLRGNLDRHVAPQPRIAGSVDFPHSTNAEERPISYGPSLSPAESGISRIQFSLAKSENG